MKKKRNRKIVISVLLAFGIFINLSSSINTNTFENSKAVIGIQSDETIDGSH